MFDVLAAAGHMPPSMAKFLGWAVIVVIIAAVLAVVLRVLGISK